MSWGVYREALRRCPHDSTRRGKRFPDALSRTVPVWIAVVLVWWGVSRAVCFRKYGFGEREIERLVSGFVGRFFGRILIAV